VDPGGRSRRGRGTAGLLLRTLRATRASVSRVRRSRRIRSTRERLGSAAARSSGMQGLYPLASRVKTSGCCGTRCATAARARG